MVVTLATLGRLGRKDADCEGVLTVDVGSLVYYGERTCPGPGLSLGILLDHALLQHRVAEGEPGILQHHTEVGGQRPSHNGSSQSYLMESGPSILTLRRPLVNREGIAHYAC